MYVTAEGNTIITKILAIKMCLLYINLMLFCLNCLLIMWADDFHYFYWEKNSFGLMIFRLSFSELIKLILWAEVTRIV